MAHTLKVLEQSRFYEETYLTPDQIQIDQLVSSTLEEAGNWKNTAALLLGGLAYRSVRIGFLSEISSFIALLKQAPFLSNALASSVALGAEVSTMRLTHQFLNPKNTALESSFFNQSWFASYLDFALLHGVGNFAKSTNPIMQHALQASGMVLGQDLGASLGLREKSRALFTQRFAEASLVTLQMNASMAFARGALGPSFSAWERAQHLEIETLEKFNNLPKENLGRHEALAQLPAFRMVIAESLSLASRKSYTFSTYPKKLDQSYRVHDEAIRKLANLPEEARSLTSQERGEHLAELALQALAGEEVISRLRVIHPWVEDLYMHLDFIAVREFRNRLGGHLNSYVAHLKDANEGVSDPQIHLISFADLPLDFEGIEFVPRMDAFRDFYLRQGQFQKTIPELHAWLMSPETLARAFNDRFCNFPLAANVDYLKDVAVEAQVTPVEYLRLGREPSLSDDIGEQLKEVPEFLRILEAGISKPHFDFIQTAWNVYSHQAYQDLYTSLQVFPSEFLKELGVSMPPSFEEMNARIEKLKK